MLLTHCVPADKTDVTGLGGGGGTQAADRRMPTAADQGFSTGHREGQVVTFHLCKGHREGQVVTFHLCRLQKRSSGDCTCTGHREGQAVIFHLCKGHRKNQVTLLHLCTDHCHDDSVPAVTFRL